MNLNTIRAVIFDLDDTLYPECEFVMSGFCAVADFLQSRYNIEREKILGSLLRRFLQGESRNNIDILFDEFNLPKANVLETVDVYRNHIPKISLFEDAREALSYCSQKNIFLALLTDGKSITQNNKINALGIRNCFNIILISDEWGDEYCKPDLRRYEYIQKEFCIPPSNILCVGDNPEKDFVAPNALNMHTVRVIRSEGVFCRAKALKGGYPEQEVHSLLNIKSFFDI